MTVGTAIRLLLLPGVVLHELAHATVATLLPGITVTEVDLTSHVEHRGRYTVLTSVLVAYAPLLVNSCVALWALLALTRLDPRSGLQQLGGAVALDYVALVTGLTALPSYTDVTAPLRLWWAELFTLRGLLLAPALLLLFAVSVPWLVVAYVRERSFVAYVGIALVYTAALAVLALDVGEGQAVGGLLRWLDGVSL